MPDLITKKQFAACFPHARAADIEKYWPYAIEVLTRYDITNKRRVAAFFAQICHESGSLRYNHEIASGEAYEGRKDLGNEFPGDGVKYKGTGLIQLTGRENFKLLGLAFGQDFINQPELLLEPKWSFMSAGWFWNTRALNRIADIDGFLTISKKINGVNKSTGFPNGWADRQICWEICKKALNVV